nr:uncharacterized protein LOC112982030 [Dromaius novaehollandiae]
MIYLCYAASINCLSIGKGEARLPLSEEPSGLGSAEAGSGLCDAKRFTKTKPTGVLHARAWHVSVDLLISNYLKKNFVRSLLFPVVWVKELGGPLRGSSCLGLGKEVSALSPGRVSLSRSGCATLGAIVAPRLSASSVRGDKSKLEQAPHKKASQHAVRLGRRAPTMQPFQRAHLLLLLALLTLCLPLTWVVATTEPTTTSHGEPISLATSCCGPAFTSLALGLAAAFLLRLC